MNKYDEEIKKILAKYTHPQQAHDPDKHRKKLRRVK